MKHFEKRIKADKKKFKDNLEYTKVHCPKVYERIKEIEQEANKIGKRDGLAAALKFIVNSKFNG